MFEVSRLSPYLKCRSNHGLLVIRTKRCRFLSSHSREFSWRHLLESPRSERPHVDERLIGKPIRLRLHTLEAKWIVLDEQLLANGSTDRRVQGGRDLLTNALATTGLDVSLQEPFTRYRTLDCDDLEQLVDECSRSDSRAGRVRPSNSL